MSRIHHIVVLAVALVCAALPSLAEAVPAPTRHERPISERVLTTAPLTVSAHAVVFRGVVIGPTPSTRFRFDYTAAGRPRTMTRWLVIRRIASRVVVTERVRTLTAGRVYRFRLIVAERARLIYGRTLTVTTAAARRATVAPPPIRDPTHTTGPPAASSTPPQGATITATSATIAALSTSMTTTSMTSSTATSASTSTTPATPATASDPAPSLTADSAPSPVGTAGKTPGEGMSTLLWGAEIGPQLTGGKPPWDMSAASAFAQLVGKAPAILPFNIPFMTCGTQCSWYWFPSAQMSAIRQYGSIPMLNWSSMSSPLSASEPAFTLAAVARGDFDVYLRSFAAGAAAWGHPFFLRFNWEMNGNWFPWGEGGNGNRPGDFVAAWRHVHDIFTAAGATNANWVWCPSVTTTNATIDLSELYPGDGYVDWTCMDGYNWGGLSGGAGGWQSFTHVFAATYDDITTRVAPGKPVMIGELGSSESGGSKALWITDMFASLAPAFPDVHALVWFDAYDGPDDWPVESSTSSREAFSAGIASPRFTSNGYAELGGSAISPP